MSDVFQLLGTLRNKLLCTLRHLRQQLRHSLRAPEVRLRRTVRNDFLLRAPAKCASSVERTPPKARFSSERFRNQFSEEYDDPKRKQVDKASVDRPQIKCGQDSPDKRDSHEANVNFSFIPICFWLPLHIQSSTLLSAEVGDVNPVQAVPKFRNCILK